MKYTNNKKDKRTSKTKLSKGAFGGQDLFLGDYKTLKVLSKSKRTKDNCNKQGISNT